MIAYGTMVFVAGRGQMSPDRCRDHRLAQHLALDLDTLVNSVKKTPLRGGARSHAHLRFGAELMALVQEHCFYHLEAPIERVTGWERRIRMRRSGTTFRCRARVARDEARLEA